MSYKIRLTESDSLTDITQILYQLGFKWRGFPLKDGVKFLCARDGVIGFISSENSFKEGFKDLKEITVEELRSMIKPKEYLFKGIDGTYKVVNHDCQGRAIEIPDGAIFLVSHDKKEAYLTFYGNKNKKGQYSYYPISGLNANTWNWSDFREDSFSESSCNKSGRRVLWSAHTQPEELPFVDDGPMTEDDFKKQLSDNVNHTHYFKDVSDIDSIDVYEVLLRFGVTDPCLQHIVKKALCTGQRGHKSLKTDMKDIHDTAVRMLAMHGIS